MRNTPDETQGRLDTEEKTNQPENIANQNVVQ
jgi:hypothetical protein